MSAHRILIVDDDADIRMALSDILDGEGYRVGEVGNGAEALPDLRAHPDTALVLLDLMMPVMDGFAFRSEQLRDATIARIPVIVMTARGPVQPGEIDAAEVLQKPLRPALLLDTIRRIVGD